MYFLLLKKAILAIYSFFRKQLWRYILYVAMSLIQNESFLS